ncbi:beta-phosphoglucomutase [Bombiscardovia apis]|uniref:Beta-phosphoglucomutase n=1 Tax=Bombiscardovia apis TaxID=2932182 RepID=A0ABN6SGX6_9BIFI|nr:HAD family phosphatase [Bombiscardovia apis]BDR54748.1 beta-phosphoglucomutase [Bombiscardovia apis]
MSQESDATGGVERGVNAGKAAIFDLDGTLLDSMGIWREIDRRFFGRRHIEMPADYAAHVASMQTGAIAQYTVERFNLQESAQDLVDEWNDDAQLLYAIAVSPKPHAVSYLRSLRESGARLAVATSLPPRLREAALGHAQMKDYFDHVCSVDDAHSKGKEEPDIYLLAASRLGIEPSHCTVFEDLLIAVKSAHRAGMKAWAMYDESSASDWDAITREADGAIRDFAQAPQLL